MPQGLQVFGADSALQFDTSDMTTRVVGTIVAQSGYSTSDPLTINGYTRDFPCPANTKPWAICLPTNGVAAQVQVSRKDSSTATLLYVLPASWPSGARIVYFYGFGKA